MQRIEVKDVEADVFRILIQTIYNSGKHSEVEGKSDKILAIMEAADMYLLPELFDILANIVRLNVEWEDIEETMENLLPQLDRVSQLPQFSKVYNDIRKGIVLNLPEDLGKKDTLWEKLSPRVQADVTEEKK